jgi:hypothetical protein
VKNIYINEIYNVEGIMEINEIIIKLNAFKKSIEYWLKQEPHYRYFPVNDFQNLFEHFYKIRDNLSSSYKSLFEGLIHRNLIAQNGTFNGEIQLVYMRSQLEFLLVDIEYCLNILSALPIINIPSMKITKEGIFFEGQQFDSLAKITEILEQAEKSIQIIDNYIDIKTLNLLSTKKESVNVNILTNPRSISPSLTEQVKSFNRQYGKLEIRKSQAFHDRFIIIDDKEFYHFGASIKDVGNRGFMFSRIEEDFVINAIREEFKKEWSSGKIII